MNKKHEFPPLPYIGEHEKERTDPFGGLINSILKRFNKYYEWNYVPFSLPVSSLQSIGACAYHATEDMDAALSALVAWQYFDTKSIEYRLLEKDHQVSVALPKQTITFDFLERDCRDIEGGNLQGAVWRALLCEDIASARWLAGSGDSPHVSWLDECDKIYLALMAAVFDFTDDDPMELIQAFVDASTHEKLSGIAFECATYIDLPSIDVMMKVFGGSDEQEYQQAMYKAVKSHHEYWSRPDIERPLNGYFSMRLTTLAKVAYLRHGYHLGFETDYVPEAFYTQPMPELNYDFLEKYKS